MTGLILPSLRNVGTSMWSPHHTLLTFFQTVFPLRLSPPHSLWASLVFPFLSINFIESNVLYFTNPNPWVFLPPHAPFSPHPLGCIIPLPPSAPCNLPQSPHLTGGSNCHIHHSGYKYHTCSLSTMLLKPQSTQGCGCPSLGNP